MFHNKINTMSSIRKRRRKMSIFPFKTVLMLVFLKKNFIIFESETPLYVQTDKNEKIYFFNNLIILSAVTGESTQDVSSQIAAMVQPHYAFLGALQTWSAEMSMPGHSKHCLWPMGPGTAWAGWDIPPSEVISWFPQHHQLSKELQVIKPESIVSQSASIQFTHQTSGKILKLLMLQSHLKPTPRATQKLWF